MACRSLKSVNIRRIGTATDLLRELNNQIDDLKEIAQDVDFSNSSECEQFSKNVLFLKAFFERYEVLIRENS